MRQVRVRCLGSEAHHLPIRVEPLQLVGIAVFLWVDIAQSREVEGEDIFHEVGGTDFNVVACLNDRDDWVKILARWIDEWAHQKAVEV